MDRWIRTYPKIFDKKECDGLIEYFEAAKDHHEETRLPGHRHFWELNLMDHGCLLYTSPSPRDLSTSRMPSSA